MTMVGGAGLAGYLLGWALMPADGGAPRAGRADRRAARHVADRRGRGLPRARRRCCSCAHWGLWFSDGIVWPVMLVGRRRRADLAPVDAVPPEEGAPVAALGPRADRCPRCACRPTRSAARCSGPRWSSAAASSSCGSTTRCAPARDVLLAVVVVVVALTLILAPWWLRLVRGLTAERAERIRSQERAEVAAHLHDSVLQTLALMQKRVDDPREVAALARRQERELRAWLNGAPRAGRADRARARSRRSRPRSRRRTASRSRSSRSATRRSTTRAEALVAAAREALVNAAKFAGRQPGRAVRRGRRRADRGVRARPRAGLRPRRACRPTAAACASRSSAGWSATAAAPSLHTAPGEGTEVELVMKR